jgi:hypothetical protein
MRFGWIAVVSTIAACNLPPEIPHVGTQIPTQLQHRSLEPAKGTTFKSFFVYEDNVVLSDGSLDFDDDHQLRFYPLDGKVEGETFRATQLVRGALYDPVYKKSYWRVVDECHGQLVIDEQGARLELDGPGLCKKAHARFNVPAAPVVTAKKSAGARGPCQRYRDCTCALADHAQGKLAAFAGAFAKNCDDAERLLATARDDPDACNTGVAFVTGMAKEAGAKLPKDCE